MKVNSVMNKAVVTLAPGDTILEASLKLSEKNISGAPVVDPDGKLIGVFSEADVLKTLKTSKKTLRLIYPSLSSISVSFAEDITEKEALEAYREIQHTNVRDIMTKEVETARPEDDVRDAIKKMVAKNINRLPVIDGGKKVIGIITRGDILKGMAQETFNSNNNHKA